MKRLLPLLAAAVVMATVAVSSSHAGAGLRGGLSLDPDDFLIGVHFQSNPIAEHLHLVPSVEAGFGDITMIAGNLDLHYLFQTSSKLEPYAGGGGTLNWFDFDRGSSLEVGGSILGGIQLNEKMFFETKIGLGDVPDWKFVVGWNLR